MREGVTNVIRHSRAKHCLIKVMFTDEYVQAEVSNDGYPREKSSTSRTGTGLSGLTERVTKLGGNIEAGPESISNGSGFQLKVKIPINNSPNLEVQ